MGIEASTVHLAAMSDLDHLDDAPLVVDRVDDPIGALPDPMALLVSRELLAPGRTRRARASTWIRETSRARTARSSTAASCSLAADVLMKTL